MQKSTGAADGGTTRRGGEPHHRQNPDVPTPAAIPSRFDPPLVRLLLREAQRRGHRLNELAAALGVTYGYLAQLRSGIRQTEHVGQEFAVASAAYLRCPPVLVKLAAGRLTLRDFAWPCKPHEREVEETLIALINDPVAGCLVPPSLLDADPELQALVAHLYRECTSLHPAGHLALPMALECLTRAAIGDAEAEAKLDAIRSGLCSSPTLDS